MRQNCKIFYYSYVVNCYNYYSVKVGLLFLFHSLLFKFFRELLKFHVLNCQSASCKKKFIKLITVVAIYKILTEFY